MKSSPVTLFVLLLLCFNATAQNKIEPTSPPIVYKVENADGTVVYTDSPAANARPVEFDAKTQNIVSGPSLPSVTTTKPKKAKPKYNVVIDMPKPQATIRNNSGDFTIQASQPNKPKAPRYQLIFNNAPIQSNTTGIFALSGVDRGEHHFKVELTDNTGKTLASSAPQTLFLHQASVLINAN